MALRLYIGNKNYSSWSMRAWVLMHELGIEFEEIKLRLDFEGSSAFRQAVASVSPAGRVPVLVDDGFAVWDTLAIAEYLHEKFGGVWPQSTAARARARSLCAEMHSGFVDLRSQCPMNIEASLPEVGSRLWSEHGEVVQDVQRVDRMWAEQLQASGGPMLFGHFSAADAFYAPVCSRIATYDLPVSTVAREYMRSVAALRGTRQWHADALNEHDYLESAEPYRSAPQTHRQRR